MKPTTSVLKYLAIAARWWSVPPAAPPSPGAPGFGAVTDRCTWVWMSMATRLATSMAAHFLNGPHEAGYREPHRPLWELMLAALFGRVTGRNWPLSSPHNVARPRPCDGHAAARPRFRAPSVTGYDLTASKRVYYAMH